MGGSPTLVAVASSGLFPPPLVIKARGFAPAEQDYTS